MQLSRRQLLAAGAGLAAGVWLAGCTRRESVTPAGDTAPLREVALPTGLRLGAATAAYQIEGAAARAGRSASVWDTFCARDRVIDDRSSGDVACDHYHLVETDLDLLKRLELQTYRFSVSWSRFMPDGVGRVNRRGIEFYSRLVDGLRNRGIVPHATLYHWDLPQVLQDRGGWANRDSAEWFGEYAATLFDRLDGVADWTTVHEAKTIVRLGYLDGSYAPGLDDPVAAGRVVHHLNLAHGRAVQAFRASRAKGRIGPSLALSPCYPADDSPAAEQHATLADVAENTLWLDPLLRSRYPAQTDRLDAALVRGLRGAERAGDAAAIARPVDFVGVAYYSPTFVDGQGRTVTRRPTSGAGWQQIDPRGLYDVLQRVAAEYGKEIVVTANGVPDTPGQTPPGDTDRVAYLHDHLVAVQQAVSAGAKVSAYYAWSLLDGFDWARGYTEPWGLVQVKRTSQRRVLKNSARWYADAARTHQVPAG